MRKAGKSGWSRVSINTECANNRYDAANAKSYDSVNIIVRYLAYKYSGARCFEIHLEYALKMQLNTNFSQNMRNICDLVEFQSNTAYGGIWTQIKDLHICS